LYHYIHLYSSETLIAIAIVLLGTGLPIHFSDTFAVGCIV